MQCPHCLENFTDDWSTAALVEDSDGSWSVSYCTCDNEKCRRIIIRARTRAWNPIISKYVFPNDFQVWPKGSSRPPLPSEVPETYSSDYIEACLVLPDSAKASAALSRRCLQGLLTGIGGATKKNLAEQIQEVIDSRQLPADLTVQLDNVRVIGNFSAHPLKSTNTGEILDVEPGEAEWNLEVLEELFDFYFVRPVRIQERRDKINAKLTEAGKPPLK